MNTVGIIFNQIKEKDRYNRKLYECRYCQKTYQKAGLGKHCSGVEHQENWKKYGTNPPIENAHPPYQRKVLIKKSLSKKLEKFI